MDAKINLHTIEQNIKDSLPPRNYGELTDGQRQSLYIYVDFSDDSRLVTPEDVLSHLSTQSRGC